MGADVELRLAVVGADFQIANDRNFRALHNVLSERSATLPPYGDAIPFDLCVAAKSLLDGYLEVANIGAIDRADFGVLADIAGEKYRVHAISFFTADEDAALSAMSCFNRSTSLLYFVAGSSFSDRIL